MDAENLAPHRDSIPGQPSPKGIGTSLRIFLYYPFSKNDQSNSADLFSQMNGNLNLQKFVLILYYICQLIFILIAVLDCHPVALYSYYISRLLEATLVSPTSCCFDRLPPHTQAFHSPNPSCSTCFYLCYQFDFVINEAIHNENSTWKLAVKVTLGARFLSSVCSPPHRHLQKLQCASSHVAAQPSTIFVVHKWSTCMGRFIA